MVLKESSAYDPSSPNHPPPSLGPGAHRTDSRATVSQPAPSTLRELEEIRSHYTIQLTDSALQIGYRLHNARRHYNLPFSSIPIGSFAQWTLFNGPLSAKESGTIITDHIRAAENMAGRMLTQQEAESFARHTSKKVVFDFYGAICAMGGGAAMAYAGRSKMKFPFRSPKPLERYDQFPNRYLPLLRGSFARTMWHMTRGSVYATLALVLAVPFIQSISNTALTAGLYNDPRSRDLTLEIRNRASHVFQRSSPGPSGRSSPRSKSQPALPEGVTNEDIGPEDYPADASARADMINDYSSNQTYPGTTPGDGSYEDSAIDSNVTDDTVQPRETKRSPPDLLGSGRGGQQQPPFHRQADTPRPQQTQDSGFDFFGGADTDDASPTAGAEPLEPIRGPQQSQSQGSRESAWDQIRRGITPSKSRHPPSPEPPSSSELNSGTRGNHTTSSSSSWRRGQHSPSSADSATTGAESFSFANSDEEKALAREMAQRDFDEMVERERRGSVGGVVGLSTATSKNSFAGYDDDASPTASVGGNTTDTTTSAWERFRKR